jgi:predicted DNA-binding ribbon-helix-helix protein
LTEPSERRDGAAVVKRSVSIAGHRTSISLEDAFWTELKAIAVKRAVPISALVAAIDAERASANLSSAIRVFVLSTALAEGGQRAQYSPSGDSGAGNGTGAGFTGGEGG